jgi:hypothetical protein
VTDRFNEWPEGSRDAALEAQLEAIERGERPAIEALGG